MTPAYRRSLGSPNRLIHPTSRSNVVGIEQDRNQALNSQNTAATVTLIETPSYAEAQRTVDLLSDRKFPVQRLKIVGLGLRSVENVTGRMTTGRAAGYGALSGLWWGLFIGLLFGILLPGGLWLTNMLWALVLGAIFGAVFGAIAHALTGGRRDFASMKTLQASSYAVMVDAAYLDEARGLLR